jgi:hypothetical protein
MSKILDQLAYSDELGQLSVAGEHKRRVVSVSTG